MFKNMKKAFTLAEVLITLVVVGVIATITIPTLQVNYTENEKRAKVKKTYSVLSQAMLRIKGTGADMSFDEIDGSQQAINDWYNTYMAPYLITQKVCYSTAGCWNEGDTYWLNGLVQSWNRTGIGLGSDIVTAVLNDGTFICIDGFSAHDMWNVFGTNVPGEAGFVVYFDINGPRKPNTIGKDIFITAYSSSVGGLVPAFKDKSAEDINDDCSSYGRGVSCIMKYLAEH